MMDKPELAEYHVLLQESVGADNDMHESLSNQSFDLCLFTRAGRTRQQHDDVAELPEQLLEVAFMLGSKNLSGSENRDLILVLDRNDCGLCCDQRLPASDITLQQAVHRMRLFHVIRDFLHHASVGHPSA